ncbi:MAG: 50S ribosomal protein L23 [Candidatus Brennerbacteria bacterium]|nr:50S ribosomal protein L23 [Candidatus Brennerbacteria bacterium]
MGIFSKKTKKDEARPVQGRARDSVAHASGTASAPARRNVGTGGAPLSEMRRVLVRPRASEKSTRLEGKNVYVFVVRDEANKRSVREEVERRYGVRVTRVNIVRRRAARRFFHGRTHEGIITKKALVTLVKGAVINLK